MKGPSLTKRLGLLVGAVVLFTATVCLGLVLSRYNSLLIDARLSEIRQEARFHGLAVEAWVDELGRDARFLANVPPIQGIVRTTTSELDPLDGSERELWLARLDTIFREMLAAKPAYAQVRYIGIADGGRELVRVDRRGDGAIYSVPAEELQQKGGRPYMRATTALGPGELHLSPVELNRERGEIQEPWLPVVRSGVPVFSEEGELFGAVIINVDFEGVFDSVSEGSMFRGEQYLMDTRGHYLRHPERAKTYGWELGREATGASDFPSVFAALQGEPESAERTGEDLLGHYVLDFGGAGAIQRFAWIVAEPRATATGITGAVVRQIAVALLAVLALAVAAGAAFARRISRPILLLADSVKEYEFEGPEVTLPEGLTGEAAVLANALQVSYGRLRQQQITLEGNNRELEQFAYIASHDLQEPLRTVTSFVSLFEEELAEDLGEEPREWLQFITEATVRMRGLIHGLLEYSRLGRNVEWLPVDLNQVVRETVADLDAAIAESGGQVDVGPLPTISGNAVSLRLLFNNLLGNALRYRRPDTPPRVTIRAFPEARGWRLEVADNGIGIPEDQRERVFLIFQRLHSDRAVAGTGIGLAHCKKIVENHHGRIWIETSPSGGAAVQIHFERTP